MATNDKQLVILIDGQEVHVEQSAEAPVAISYLLEDGANFQDKQSAQALNIEVPATQQASKVANSFHEPNTEDTSPGQYYRNPRPAAILANGITVFQGRALLQTGSKTDRPESYTWDMLGQNGDWLVQLQEKSLWDTQSGVTHLFNEATVVGSWAHNGAQAGQTLDQDYVYALVRYKRRFNALGNDQDKVATMYHMRPALFIWPIIARAFQSIGYRISSTFLDTNYARRLVLPWVWGNFLKIESKLLDVLKFKARIATGYSKSITGVGSSQTVNEHADTVGLVWNNETTLTAYDNGSTFSWSGSLAQWTYLPLYYNQFGALIVGFHAHIILNMSVGWNSNASVFLECYVNGVLSQSILLKNVTAGATSTSSFSFSPVDVYYDSPALNSGDVVGFRLKVQGFKTNLGQLTVNIVGDNLAAGAFESYVENTYFKKPLGGLVDLKIYDKFKAFKFLDLLRGLCDTFDLVPQTDSVEKVLYLEPAYPYIWDDTTGMQRDGYFKQDRLDWTAKQDLLQKSVVTSFSEIEREQIFKFKDDTNDGGVQKYKGRYNVEAGSAKYIFPARFKTGKKDVANRFFSPVVHYRVQQWRSLTGVAPQLMVLVPENIANTSADEAESQLQPKLAYYKGLMPRAQYGGWYWQPDPATSAVDTTKDLPYMFAVNYGHGGEADPVLAYNDQNINGTLVRGLLRRFFLPRLAVMDYGKRLQAWLRLNNNDVTNWLHREAIVLDGADYYLTGIDKFKPLLPVSTQCTFWKYSPVTAANVAACFPSQNSVLNNPASLPAGDMLYQPLLLLNTDIP